MAQGSVVRIEGLNELQRKLGQLEADKITRQVLRLQAKSIINEAGKYPPQLSPRPGSNLQYKRGVGAIYMPTGRVITPSENLGKRWYFKSKPRQVTMGNRASYAPRVHGTNQAFDMTHRGWERLDKTAKKHLPTIIKAIEREIKRIWER